MKSIIIEIKNWKKGSLKRVASRYTKKKKEMRKELKWLTNEKGKEMIKKK